MKIAEFNQTGILEILLLLLEKDLKITEITKSVSQHSAYRSIYILLNLNLIEEHRGEYNQKYHRLTAKGKKVATKLAEIEEILQED
ncbi:MAG: hypothetical protein ACTSQE_16560 [Candidatus Heimdallarchaeaceae archaeon]